MILNKKVLSKLGEKASFKFSADHIESIVKCKQGAIERALLMVRESMQIFNNNPPPAPSLRDLHKKTRDFSQTNNNFESTL